MSRSPFAVLLAAAAAGAAAASPRPDLKEGRVTYLTATRAFLDRGKAEGLEVGTELKLERPGKRAATCRVESVADHTATCAGTGIQVGDTFPAPRESQAGAAARQQELPAPAELSRTRAAVQAARLPLVAFRASPIIPADPRGASVEARVTDLGWFGANGFHQERVDLTVRALPVAFGARLDLDATALSWTRRPARFLSPTTTRPNQLLVRQAALSLREGKLPVTFAVGRLWPWAAPGIDAVDGAQVGYRPRDGGWEAGAFGGVMPDPLTTLATPQRSALGGYFTGRLDLQQWLALSHESRVSLMSAPEYGSRVEGEGRLRATLWRTLDLGAEVRLGVGGAQAPGAVDAARLDADLRVLGSFLRVGGGVRYLGNEAIDLITIGVPGRGTRSLHADATVTVRPLSWLSLALTGLAARDLQTGAERGLLSGELDFPLAFGHAGGMAVGWMEERGWLSGRSPYVQLNVRPFEPLTLFGRIAYSDEGLARAPDAPPGRDLALWVSVEYQPWRWLTVRCTAAGRTDLRPVLDGEEGVRALFGGPNGLTLQTSVGVNL